WSYAHSFFFFSSRRRHTRSKRDWSSDVCSSDLARIAVAEGIEYSRRGLSLSPVRGFYSRAARPRSALRANGRFNLVGLRHGDVIRPRPPWCQAAVRGSIDKL